MYCLFPRLIGQTKSRLVSSLSFLPLRYRKIYCRRLTTNINTRSAFSVARSHASFLLKLVSPMVLAFAMETVVPPPAMLLQTVLAAVALLQRRTKVLVPAWAGVVLSL
jgi:hypothetical protein